MTLPVAVEQKMRVIVAEELAKALPSIVPTIVEQAVPRIVAALQRGEEGGNDN